MSRLEGDVALGVQVTGGLLPGLVENVSEPLPTVAVELGNEGAIGHEWSAATAPRVVLSRSYGDGSPFLTVEHDQVVGYRLWADRHGTHLVAPDGRRCLSALPPEPSWRAMKLMASQLMPLLATLHGREVTHAAGVVVHGHLVGIAAASGTGKSSTTAHLIARGARFFADDVLALEATDGAVRAHPGMRLANVREQDLAAIASAGRARLGSRLGQSDKVHLHPEGFPGALALSAMVFLSRRPGGIAGEITALDDPVVRLLGNAFLPHLDHADRLAGQLDVAAAMVGTVPLVGLEVGAGEDAAAVARRIEAWVEAELPGQR